MRTRDYIYQLKITLDNTSPPVWRRVLIPANATFRELHETMQLSFGWLDSHLHDFQVRKSGVVRPHSITDLTAQDIEPWWDNDEKSDERRVKVSGFLHAAGDR
ncbi:plasmid pRiA4b ORF-3 family protein [Candidatus Peregrinibacteria bacterium]|nr:plasmid pRiA4b ORF-3 family protein [Candidatus Peregrinibacteria bacterium]